LGTLATLPILILEKSGGSEFVFVAKSPFCGTQKKNRVMSPVGGRSKTSPF